MAKVLEVYPAKDNTVRVVRLKTQSGEIYPLEIKCTDDESPSSGKPLTTRSGRTVKVPSRFLDLNISNYFVSFKLMFIYLTYNLIIIL
ncbi:hypothetical protein TNCT_537921 [Trichonephila clavata]|uniref:Uncharacterized protein n=1 Tax=Trichonephila clavata TaxID=2740835 RepID=A0A8X6GEG6_TRICU|nr:hypothetical protein TNCT_537921 [Trichonephila clavata]